jgi:hypothetical protein
VSDYTPTAIEIEAGIRNTITATGASHAQALYAIYQGAHRYAVVAHARWTGVEVRKSWPHWKAAEAVIAKLGLDWPESEKG